MSPLPATPDTGNGNTSPAVVVADVENGLTQSSSSSADIKNETIQNKKKDDLQLTATPSSPKSPTLLQSIVTTTADTTYIPPDYSFEDRASPFSRIFLLYLDPLFKLGTKRNLNHEDLGKAAAQDKCVQLFETFSYHWKNELKKAPEKRSLWMVLWRTTGWTRVSSSILLYAISAGISYGPILILNQLVVYFQGGNNLSPATLWIFVALMFVLPMSASIFMAQSNIIVAHIGIQFRNCLVNMIYRKALKLSPASRQQQSTGMIVNMFSNDTKQIQSFLFFFNNCLIAPFQIVVCLILIYLQVGPATFVGLGIMFCVIPFNFYIFMMLNRIRLKKVKKTDIRVKLMNEILSGIRVIKFYAWESAFEKNILAVRKEELMLLKQMAYIVAFGFTLVLMAVPLVQPILVFYTYVQLGNQLTAATAFTTIALFNMLQFPFAFLPLGLSQYSQSLVSTKRMLNFFVSDELDGYVTSEERGDNIVISAQNLSVCWIKDPPPSAVTAAADGSGDGLISKSASQVSLNTVANASSNNNNNAATNELQSSQPMSDKKSTKNVQFNMMAHDDNDNDKNNNNKEYNAVPNNDGTENDNKVDDVTNVEDDHHQLVDIELTSGPVASGANTSTPALVAPVPATTSATITTTGDNDGSLMSSKSALSPSVVSGANNRSYKTLVDMNLRIEKGSLVAVVGNVGSGKSSFLSALLGEMHCQNGSVNVVGSVAYCEQRPWILNASVEQNILFGEPMNQKRFDAAMHAACLEEDIKVLPGGIHTEIGERGINLSGGQKARVALARAVYKKADLYLLDDPLSAVDAHVGQHIFKHCIKNTLKGSTRILVTHQVHLLNQCDLIIVLDDGKIKAQGSYEDLQKSGVDISNYIPFYDSDEESNGELTEYTDGSVTGSDSDEDEEDNDLTTKANDYNTNTNNSDGINKQSVTLTSDHAHHQKSVNIKAVNDSWKLSVSSATPATTSAVAAVSDVVLEETKQEVIRSNSDDVDTHTNSTAVVPTDDKSVAALSTTPAATATDSPASPLNDEDKAKADADARHLDARGAINIISIEERIMGDVSMNVYSYYIRAGGIFLFFLVIACLLATQATQLVAQFFLASWGDKTANAVVNGGNGLSTSENIQQLNTYAWLSMLPLIFMVLRALGLADHRLGTSVKLHRDCLHRILGAPTAFFDVTPLGRILNRFSSDMLTIDEELSQTISQLSNSVFQCLGAIAAVAGATKGTFLVLMAPLAVFYFQVQKLFRKTNTTIARLESISRSPIYTDFSQALVGAISIRAYKDENRFITKLEQCIDNNSVAAVTSALCSQWLAMRLDFVGACITFFIALIAVATNGNFIPAGYLALGLTNAFQVTTYLKFAVRMIATAEAQMNSVERIKLYAEQVPQEELDGSDDHGDGKKDNSQKDNKRNGSLYISNSSNKDKTNKKNAGVTASDPAAATVAAVQEIPADWPSKGEIKVLDIQMAYRDGPLVLKGVSFNVRGGMKVGIAGRTGSGKSSLMIALFRIQELSAGSITIDGIDTSKVPLRVLRSKLGIIPQDPVMFSATVRFNLDPFNEHTDLEIWNILESVDMKNHIVTMERGLNEEVAEGGDNFSAGQRQLICIARALLRQPKILVLDEATASIDNETDTLIQRTIRNSFKDCTVLTIAHRLHTIIDSDRIIVLDNGKLAEIGPPVELLEKPLADGLFRSLWEKHQASHLEGDYPAYPLADEITLKRTVVRSESSMRAGAFKRTKSSHKSHSNRQFPRNSSAESLGSNGSGGGSLKKSSHKKSKRAIVESNNQSMRDSMMSIPETADENAIGGGATPKTK